MLIWRLVFAHFISDFLLQNRWIIRNKARFSGLAMHSLIYFLVLLASMFDLISAQVLPVLICLAVLHGVVDYLKGACKPWFGRMQWLLFIGDQAVHALTILIAAGILSAHDQATLSLLLKEFPLELLVKYTTLMIITVVVGIHFTDAVLDSALDGDTELDAEQERSSRAIGIAERFLITIAVLVNHYELIAFLIAAKSIIRLPEAQSDKNAREATHFSNYFLVGTFVSYAWALAIAILFKSMFL
ncbi:MAG: DUF3307 domain-containing protein [Candidatus Cloacimonetes bacterium]|nr:DUF3307 domain-containing protein [Candidatus Cloacimonadota bacterium]